MIAAAVRRCGMHEEKQRSAEDDDDAGDARGSGKNKKHKAERVFRYTFMDPDDNRLSKPMFVIAYEELYNSSLTEVTAIRIWKFVRLAPHRTCMLASAAERARRPLTNRTRAARAGL